MSFTPIGQETSVTTTAATTVVSAPGASTQRIVRNIRITNNAGSAIGVVLQVVKNGTPFSIYTNATLGAGASVDVAGPFILDATDETIELDADAAGDVDVVAAYADRS